MKANKTVWYNIRVEGIEVFLFAPKVPPFTVRPDSFDKIRQNVDGGILFEEK